MKQEKRQDKGQPGGCGDDDDDNDGDRTMVIKEVE